MAVVVSILRPTDICLVALVFGAFPRLSGRQCDFVLLFVATNNVSTYICVI